ncbi:MAG: J domain-containing protein [Lishizhenia sp.]
MKDKYFKILGLSNNASAKEIKKAYRKLVFKYHPDKDASDFAQEQFLKIQEAYEILTDQKKIPTSSRKSYQSAKPYSHQNNQRAKAKKQNTADAEKAQRFKRAQERFERQKARKARENERYYKLISEGKLWRIFRSIVWVSSLLAVFFIVDAFLKTKKDKVRIEWVSKQNGYRGFSGMELVEVRTMNNGDFWVSNELSHHLSRLDNVYIEKTAWMNGAKNLVIINKDGSTLKFKIDFTADNYLLFVICVLLLPLFTLLIKSKTIFYSFLFHFCLYFYGAALVVFLCSNDRWIHLVTFGYL